MSNQCPHLMETADELRREFDCAFASPARHRDTDVERFLAVGSAGQALALRIGDLTRLEVRGPIMPLPVDRRELLGIAGIQGRLVPVYCLASLLGFERNDVDWRWIAVGGHSDSLGLAFELLDASFSVSKASILDLGGDQAARGHVRYAVRFEDEIRHVVELHSIQAAIRNTTATSSDQRKESLS